ncbi:hypothetical protein JG687_00017982 [Phytophthora cactorum]|nr:hypothetical protein PC121_g7970 [Phytophthora cactorum]KAG6944229.1 hypothetical protein JG687_00017982 [Phytophthora cactorum]
MPTGSSEVFNDSQLAQMKLDGWEVLPENVEAEMVDDPVVDMVYSGYWGPSQDIMASTKSALQLFYYFLPKAFWRGVASQSNLYWAQTLDARLEQAVEKERSVTRRTQRSRDSLWR